MKNISAGSLAFLLIIFSSCTNDKPRSEPHSISESIAVDSSTVKKVETVSIDSSSIALAEPTLEEKIELIREKFNLINNEITAGAYTIIEFKVDGKKGVIQYKRVMDGEEIRFLSVTYNSTFGSDKTSYYFWEDLVVFQFQENTQWVDHQDYISEKRTYYYGEEVIKCLQREIKETGGYDQVKQKLANTAQTILPKEGKFDRETIKNLIDLTEKEAIQTPDILSPRVS